MVLLCRDLRESMKQQQEEQQQQQHHSLEHHHHHPQQQQQQHPQQQQQQQQQQQSCALQQQQQSLEQQQQHHPQSIAYQQPDLPLIIPSASPCSSMQLSTPKRAIAAGPHSSLPAMPQPRTKPLPHAPAKSPSSTGLMLSPTLRATTPSHVHLPASDDAVRAGHLQRPSAAGHASARTSCPSPAPQDKAASRSVDYAQHASSATDSALQPELVMQPLTACWDTEPEQGKDKGYCSSKQHKMAGRGRGTPDSSRGAHDSSRGAHDSSRGAPDSSSQQHLPPAQGRGMLTASVAAALRSSLMGGAAPQDSVLTSAVFEDFTREVHTLSCCICCCICCCILFAACLQERLHILRKKDCTEPRVPTPYRRP